MRSLTRLAAIGLLGWMVLAPRIAAADTLRTWQSGDWSAGAYAANDTKQFTQCRASRPMDPKTNVVLLFSRSGHWVLVLMSSDPFRTCDRVSAVDCLEHRPNFQLDRYRTDPGRERPRRTTRGGGGPGRGIAARPPARAPDGGWTSRNDQPRRNGPGDGGTCAMRAGLSRRRKGWTGATIRGRTVGSTNAGTWRGPRAGCSGPGGTDRQRTT